jgi:hypothetical protein
MRIRSLEVVFHRTVRVPEGRSPSNLPPSLGAMKAYKVSAFKERCPENWEEAGIFLALHDTEAMWMSFSEGSHPVALLVGAGGVNALTGDKLGTKLAKDNYLVAPPQPWLDGWKSDDGCVYQFVATPHKKGKGVSVGEQLIGEESKTGALGIALFDPKEPEKLKFKPYPTEGWSGSMVDNSDFKWGKNALLSLHDGEVLCAAAASTASASKGQGVLRKAFDEMGIGKGGKIYQKIYPDPHGLEVWKEAPTQTMAIYLVNAHGFEEITGEKIPAPVTHHTYSGPWFGLADKQEAAVPGTGKFTGLKSAVFPGDTENAPAGTPASTPGEAEAPVSVEAKGAE